MNLSRRAFLKAAGLGAAGMTLGRATARAVREALAAQMEAD